MFDIGFILALFPLFGFPPLFAGIVDSIKGFFDMLLSKLKEYIEAIVSAIKASVDWVIEKIHEFIGAIGDILKSIWQGIQDIFQVVLDCVWWIGHWLWDLCFAFLYWCLGLIFSFLVWVIDQFPAIDLPQGFSGGLLEFVRFGKLLDSVLPVTELLSLIVLYVTIYVFLVLVKYIWRFIIAVIP